MSDLFDTDAVQRGKARMFLTGLDGERREMTIESFSLVWEGDGHPTQTLTAVDTVDLTKVTTFTASGSFVVNDVDTYWREQVFDFFDRARRARVMNAVRRMAEERAPLLSLYPERN